MRDEGDPVIERDDGTICSGPGNRPVAPHTRVHRKECEPGGRSTQGHRRRAFCGGVRRRACGVRRAGVQHDCQRPRGGVRSVGGKRSARCPCGDDARKRANHERAVSREYGEAQILRGEQLADHADRSGPMERATRGRGRRRDARPGWVCRVTRTRHLRRGDAAPVLRRSQGGSHTTD